jgi:acyl dehydratase
MIRFASEWDPYPFHIDPQAARSSVFGRLCASGLHTLLLSYRLFGKLKLFDGTTLAGLGIEHLRFHRPLFPGDAIRVRVEVAETVTTNKADRGMVKLRLATHNQAGELVMDLLLPLLVERLKKQGD